MKALLTAINNRIAKALNEQRINLLTDLDDENVQPFDSIQNKDINTNSKTVYKTLKTVNDHSFIEALLCTGKTHQLRLHFLSKGAPIVGDMLYGKETPDGILHLHSYYLEFVHPITKEVIHLESYPTWYEKQSLKVTIFFALKFRL